MKVTLRQRLKGDKVTLYLKLLSSGQMQLRTLATNPYTGTRKR